MPRNMKPGMPLHISTLSRQQLQSIAEIRGEAIVRFTQTVTELRDMEMAGTLRDGDLDKLYMWVENFMTEVIIAETMACGGGWTPEPAP